MVLVRMKLKTILLSLTFALSVTATHAAPTAKQVLETQGAGEPNCPEDERGTITEIRMVTATEAAELTSGQMETNPSGKYLLIISTLSPAAAASFGEPTQWSMMEVDANVKIDELKPMIGAPSCHFMGD